MSQPKPEIIFELKDVQYKYGNVEVLRNISFQVKKGEQIVILGANGSGKSTLLRLLDGLYFPTSGMYQAFGSLIDEEYFADDGRAFRFRRQVGLVFQDPDVQLFSPTVWDEVTFAPLHLGLQRQQVIQRAESALKQLDIFKLKDRPPHLLSGGEKKKVSLASVLSLQPEVWLFDEPTASLDPRSQSKLLDFLDDLAHQGKTVITATHDLNIVEEIAARVLVLSEDHELIADADPHTILSDAKLLTKHNLIHEHRHTHGGRRHKHVHTHEIAHHHQHPHG